MIWTSTHPTKFCFYYIINLVCSLRFYLVSKLINPLNLIWFVCYFLASFLSWVCHVIHVDIIYTWIYKHSVYPRGNDKYKFENYKILPKWKKDAKEFAVSVTHHKTRGYQSYLPKPIMELLGKPNSIKFVIKGKKIELKSDEDK